MRATKTSKRYAFHLKNDTTIEGLLVKQTRSDYLLLKAAILEAEDRSRELSGHVVVPRENVYVVQEIQG